MGILLLCCAASIILPIIRAEGILPVFFPYLVRSPQARAAPHLPMSHPLLTAITSASFEVLVSLWCSRCGARPAGLRMV